MRKPLINKIVIAASIVLAIFLLSGIEIGSFKIKAVTYPILWISIGVLGFKYFKTLRGRNSAIRKSLLGLGLAFYVFGTWYFIFSFFLCAEIDRGVSFLHKKDKSLSLVCRTFECYGTSSSCQLYKVRNLTTHIKWVTKYNENPVDTSKWH